MVTDRHIHTPFCPHGSQDSFKAYIETAIQIGYHSMSFTEHAPLPEGFDDPVPTKDSSMSLNHMESYLSTLNHLKKSYKKDINVHIGLEVDYIEGYEQEIKSFLNTYGPELDDSLLSVHFIKTPTGYLCLDYSLEMFQHLIYELNGLNNVYHHYYQAVEQAIDSDLGNNKPTRIGHLTLIHKFQQKFPAPFSDERDVVHVLEKIKKAQFSLDMNSAGLRKPYCLETYPPTNILKQAQDLGIPLIYGSDAHKAEDLGKGLQELKAFIEN